MNCVQLVGRLTADPEISMANSGTTIAKFSLAVDRRFKKEGEPTADFLRCVAFSKTAEFFEKYVHKGNKIGIIGRIQTGSYKNKDGQTVYTTDIMVESAEFVESKAAAQQNQDGGQTQTPGADGGFMNIPDDIAEELPFN